MNLIECQHADLKQMQEVMGSVNHVAQMAPLLRFHKRSGNSFLSRFSGNENILLVIPDDVKADMLTIAKEVESAVEGLPIASSVSQPTLSALVFYTDAAGASFLMVKGRRIFHNNVGKGVSCIAGSNKDDVWAWPSGLLTDMIDEKGVFFGCKSTTLESIGMILPMITFPDTIWGRNIVFMIDNMAVMFGWYNGYAKNDKTASEVLRAVQYLAGVQGVTVHVKHVPRKSDDLADLADEISRKDSGFSGRGRRIIEGALFRSTGALLEKALLNCP